MSYAGSRIQTTNSSKRPRKALNGIFDDLQNSFELSRLAKEMKIFNAYHSVLDERISKNHLLSCRIYLLTYLLFLLGLIISMVL